MALSLVACCAAACGPELSEVRERGAAIVNGELDEGHLSVGALLSEGLCTATLIGERTILTAAHCVSPGKVHTFVVAGRRIRVDKLTRHPDYINNPANIVNDIAIGRLRERPSGVMPTPVGVGSPDVGQEVTLVGVGNTSNQGGSGFKRKAINLVWKKEAKKLSYRGAGGGAGNLCNGDSGGPTFALLNGQDVQVGVHSYGVGLCGQQATDMRVDAYLGWLREATEGDLVEGGAPDPQGPSVRIESPSDGSTIYPDTAIEVAAEDNVGIASVTLFVDGEEAERKDAPPYSFNLALAIGKHELEAVAQDLAGNKSEAGISVTVEPSGGFGERCDADAACENGFCAAPIGRDVRFCSVGCTPGGNDCPVDAVCKQLGARVGCEPAGAAAGEDSGGCSVAPHSAPRPWLPMTLLLTLALALAAHRRRR